MTPEEQALVDAVSEKLAPQRYVWLCSNSFGGAPYYVWDRINHRAVWEGWNKADAIVLCADLNAPRP
jgi:hypothetical protein